MKSGIGSCDLQDDEGNNAAGKDRLGYYVTVRRKASEDVLEHEIHRALEQLAKLERDKKLRKEDSFTTPVKAKTRVTRLSSPLMSEFINRLAEENTDGPAMEELITRLADEELEVVKIKLLRYSLKIKQSRDLPSQTTDTDLLNEIDLLLGTPQTSEDADSPSQYTTSWPTIPSTYVSPRAQAMSTEKLARLNELYDERMKIIKQNRSPTS